MIAVSLPNQVSRAVALSVDEQVQCWKNELGTLLNETLNAVVNYLAARSILPSALSLTKPSITLFDASCQVFSCWIHNLCEQANDSVTNRSNLKIEAEHLPAHLRYFDFDVDEDEIEQFPEENGQVAKWLIERLMNSYDFSGLKDVLETISSKVERKGFEEAANQLARHFLLTSRGIKEKPAQVRSVKGFFELKLDYDYTRSNSRIGKLESLKTFLSVVEKETGATGFLEAIDILIAKEDELPKDKCLRLPTHTIVEAGKVRIAVFKEWIKFQMKPELLEALYGFIRQYSSLEIRKISVQ